MKIDLTTKKDIAVIAFKENVLDVSNAKDTKLVLKKYLEPHTKIVFDMSTINFIDSSGVGVLLSCLRELNSKQGHLKLVGVTQQVMILFKLLRMQKILSIYSTEEEAIQSFT